MNNRSIALPMLLLFCFLSLTSIETRLCNGFEQLCKRRYNQVVYPATHNGHSYKESDVHNQDLPLKEQLECGIRATKLHVWYDTDATGKVVPFVCHGIDKSILYNPPLDKAMEQVPFLFRSFTKTLLEKAKPLKQLVLDAFHYAYGTDNATGATPFKHCILDPAAQPLEHALQVVATFLLEHPHEVITLILEDHTRNSSAIHADFKKVNLLPYVHTQDKDQPWPFLQDMLDSNKRLVVFLQGNDSAAYKNFPWMHYLWDYAWDTKWDFKDVGHFKDASYDTIPFRGEQAFARRFQKPKNKLFIVHHFLTDFIGGSKSNALKANKKTVLKNRLKRLEKEAGQLPTIVQVDFFEYPNNEFVSVINELNGVSH